jgi:hypothetical protein
MVNVQMGYKISFKCMRLVFGNLSNAIIARAYQNDDALISIKISKIYLFFLKKKTFREG